MSGAMVFPRKTMDGVAEYRRLAWRAWVLQTAASGLPAVWEPVLPGREDLLAVADDCYVLLGAGPPVVQALPVPRGLPGRGVVAGRRQTMGRVHVTPRPDGVLRRTGGLGRRPGPVGGSRPAECLMLPSTRSRPRSGYR